MKKLPAGLFLREFFRKADFRGADYESTKYNLQPFH